jgi:hypothetical protein
MIINFTNSKLKLSSNQMIKTSKSDHSKLLFYWMIFQFLDFDDFDFDWLLQLFKSASVKGLNFLSVIEKIQFQSILRYTFKS